MKKILDLTLVFGILLAFTACSDDNNNDGGIELEGGGTSTTATIYADETSGKPEGIKFVTKGAWQATVSEIAARATSSGSNVGWLTLNQYSATEAGEYTLTLALEENYTGKDRKAKIKIVSSGSSISIMVEQKKTTQDGKEPDDPSLQDPRHFVETVETYYSNPFYGELLTETRVFLYNKEMQLVKVENQNHESEEEDTKSIEFFYKGNTISYTIECYHTEGTEVKLVPHTTELTLNSEGFVTSAKRTSDKSYWSCTYQDGYINASNGFVDDTEPYRLTRKIEWTDRNITKVIDQDGWSTNVTYMTKEKNPKVNLDINWIIDSGSEPRLFMVASDHSWDISYPFAMGLYGKTPPFYIKEESDTEYGRTQVYTYEYIFDSNDLVTQITIKDGSNDHIVYKISYFTK